MREIKFRAWNPRQDQMIWNPIVNEIAIDKYIGLNEVIERLQKEKFDVMQFTGLKDKNGKEIYEGDILGYWGKAFWPVFWGTSKAGFCFGNPNTWETLLSESSIRSKQVIRNIYENPELLKSLNPQSRAWRNEWP